MAVTQGDEGARTDPSLLSNAMPDIDLRPATAKYQQEFADVATSHIIPSFDINGHAGTSKILTRGHIEMSRGVPRNFNAPDDLVRYGLRFMLNPSALAFSYAFDQTDFFDGANDSGANYGAAFMPSQQSFSLQLLFDRTIEVYNGKSGRRSMHPELDHPYVGEIGVQEDVFQFQKLLGNHNSSFFTSVATQPVPVLFFPALPPNGNINVQNGSIFGLGGGAWKPIQAWIEGATINYTQFSHAMVPQRAVIDMSFRVHLTAPNILNTGFVAGGSTTGGGPTTSAGGNPLPPSQQGTNAPGRQSGT